MDDNITLLADIGATNARFALSVNHSCPDHLQVLQCADYPTPEDAINDYLEARNIINLDHVCLAIAGPVINDVVNVTNNHWVLDANKLKARYKLKKILFLNDFEAIAYSIPQLTKEQFLSLSQRQAMVNQNDHFNYLVLGAGSGLGVASLIKREETIFAIVSEGGHANFSPVTEVQIAIFNILRNKHHQISNEMLLSGPGIINIYQSLCEVEGVKQNYTSAQQICEAANKSEDYICTKSLDVFFEILGQVAADLTLTFRSFDGVYIAGGIIQRYSGLITNSRFNECFENKSQHIQLLQNTPRFLITETHPGLMGAHYCSVMQTT
jgi:glucokinase